MPKEEMRNILGVHFEDPSNIRAMDDIFLIGFLLSGKVVHYTEIKNQQADISISEYLTPSSM